MSTSLSIHPHASASRPFDTSRFLAALALTAVSFPALLFGANRRETLSAMTAILYASTQPRGRR